MGECYNCSRLEERYDNLYRRYDRLLDSYHDLEKKYENTYIELDSANFKIKTELEPRIQSERRSYDTYVTSGGGDVCFSIGMSGNCGYSCPMFGEKSECFENVTTEEQILEIYQNYANTGYIIDLIEDFGLQKQAKDIDRELLRDKIKKHKEEIEKLEKEILNI